MIKEKVGRDDWKQLKVGETGVFTLPDERAVECARVALGRQMPERALRAARTHRGLRRLQMLLKKTVVFLEK